MDPGYVTVSTEPAAPRHLRPPRSPTRLSLRVQTRMEQRLGPPRGVGIVHVQRHLTGEEVAEALHLCNSVASKLATLGVASDTGRLPA